MSIQIITDLRPKFLPARDQGVRPTCMAFAASDAHSFAHSVMLPFSAEYAFYHGVKGYPPHDPTGGVPMSVMLEVLKVHGQPHEGEWPYLAQVPTPLSTWIPPRTTGKIYQHLFDAISVMGMNAFDIIDRGEAVLLIVSITEQFFNLPDPEVIRDLPGDPYANVHALIGVGTGGKGTERLVLARNSWGSTWGFEGHIWIAESYLSGRLLEMATPRRN